MELNPIDGGMSDEAKMSDANIVVEHILVSRVYADPNFNCRGHISPLSVVDLAKSIAKDGLQCPITVRPREQQDPEGYTHVVISGHRRHKAYIVNQSPTIPCIVRTGLNEFKRRTLNAIENLKRQDLNMLQEARTVEHFKLGGFTRDEVAAEVGMSPGWVQIRFMLLDLEPEIQDAAAQGFFTTTNIRDLYSIKDQKKRFDAAKAIKDGKIKGDKQAAKSVIKPKRTPETKRKRSTQELTELLKEIQKTIGNSFTTRCIAWAAGNLSDMDIYTDLQNECAKNGIIYEVPDFIDTLMEINTDEGNINLPNKSENK